ncbi:MAG TPA: fumarylacetoacetate hydrolase family protein [Ilumatobacteraceae bacterium]|nr:fumarylacetoacetate hydrolase family protein [Ilumatobacteraceae bacterium]
MKIARFTEGGNTRLGIVATDTDEIIDVGTADPSLPTDVGVLLATGSLADVARTASSAQRIALSAVQLEAPIAQPPTFLAIGLNYADHVAESGMDKPKAPVVFNKQITCVVGPGAGIEVPTVAPKWVDYEGELGVVIGTRCRNVSVDDAPSVVAGYLIVNDVSVRDWQRATPTMTMGKSWDTHGPTGPWLVSPDEVGDPHDLSVRTWVDGDLRQDASTKQMITNCWELIAHLSTAFTLLPGTIIATGTPAGVGFVMDPPRCLNPGSTVRIEIDKLGVLENPVIAQP